ncbi:hypothetical protein QBC37DRAFT_193316 [Rhypophila decipiens]|uniref:Uncharacterized protein n=1 Tax=Rhypophila decipiens TaxID=261697 RepID=A0AAN6Y4D4_9PEZI|nr:hypothetical protein QBC37DRAFT_193316 [Rhypophila decipiens]
MDQDPPIPTVNKPTASGSSASGIPRPSKLPLQTSKLPVPRPNPLLRTTPSREALAGRTSNIGTAGSGTLRNPKLRATPSRDQLTSNLAAPIAKSPGPAIRLHPNATQSRTVSSPQQRASFAHPASAKKSGPRYIPPPRPGIPDGQDLQTSSAARVPRRQPSTQWISADSPMLSPGPVSPDIEESYSPSETPPRALDQNPAAKKLAARSASFEPRPSLAERTIETLSRLPSSPSVRGKAGAPSFFDPPSAQKNALSRPSSRHGLSRPGSSGSTQDRPGSSGRPGSSSGPEEGISNFRASINANKSPLSTIEGTPLRGRRSIQSFQPLMAPSTTPGKSVRSSIQGIPQPSALPIPRSRTPSPEKRSDDVVMPRSGMKPLAGLPAKKPSVNGLFRKPSVPNITKTGADKPQTSTTTARKQFAFTSELPARRTTTTGTATTTDETELAPVPTYRKTSTALRDQIAKAKAAKRAAAEQKLGAKPAEAPLRSPLVPRDTSFDFDLPADPFNQHRDDQSQAKILQGRLQTARTSGRLNIAAMGLKEIPEAVMNMYNLESVDQPGGAWAESVDLTRFVAADNELESIADAVFPDVDPATFADDEESQGNIFAGLETLDLHGNKLSALPMGLRRLELLTSLNLFNNKLANNGLEVISKITSLRDLKLGGNMLSGTLDPCFFSLTNLEILDLHNNKISSLPPDLGNLGRLRILNVSQNEFGSLPFDILATLPITEITARKNRLTGTLIPESVAALPTLQTLDVSSNQLSHLYSESKSLGMPALSQLCLSINRLQSLPDVSAWRNLVTLAADENSISAMPTGFTSLGQLRSADLSSNDIRVVPAEIGHMEKLAVLRLSGNPLREKKFCSIDTDELKAILAQRLEPPPDHLAAEPEPAVPVAAAHPDEDELNQSDNDHFATPPTSAPVSPARSRAHTLTGQTWPVKVGGVLDRSRTESSTLHPLTCSRVAAAAKVTVVHLHHNLFQTIPDSLSFFASSMTALTLSHNQLNGETYMGGPEGNAADQVLDLPALTELNLSNNHISGLAPLLARLRAPALQKLDVSFNRISALPQAPQTTLRGAFPNLTILHVNNNHMTDLDPESIRGLKYVDAKNNDIAHLNPKLGLLGGKNNTGGGLEFLDVSGNRFRVPRFNVLERGTEVTLKWLRNRIPVAEMGPWNREEEGEGDGDED